MTLVKPSGHSSHDIFAINYKGVLRALAADTGAIRWSAQLPEQQPQILAQGDHTIAIGTHSVVGYDRSNGRCAWLCDFPRITDWTHHPQGILVAAETPASGYEVILLDMTRGTAKWKVPLRGRPTDILSMSPAVCVFGEDGLMIIRESDGTTIDTVPLIGAPNEVERLTRDTVAVRCTSTIEVIDVRKTDVLWKKDTDGLQGLVPLVSGLATLERVDDSMHCVVSHSMETGHVLWKKAIASQNLFQIEQRDPARHAILFFVRNRDQNRLAALSCKNGEVLWTNQVENNLLVPSAAIEHGDVVIVSGNTISSETDNSMTSQVKIYGINTGRILWTLENTTGSTVSTLLLDERGILVTQARTISAYKLGRVQ